MAHVNHSINFVDENFVNVFCGTCNHSVRGTRTEYKVWLQGDNKLSTNTFQENCPSCGSAYIDWTPSLPSETTLQNEFVRFETSVAEVISHYGQADDIDLDTNISFILLDKEEQRGLNAFTVPERHVYAIQGLVMEVNNGGFDQFFYNSTGRLAYDLVPALEAVGSVEVLEIVRRAVELFGKSRNLSERSRHSHLRKITKDGELNLWDELDSEFYDATESIEPLVLRYIKENLEGFVS